MLNEIRPGLRETRSNLLNSPGVSPHTNRLSWVWFATCEWRLSDERVLQGLARRPAGVRIQVQDPQQEVQQHFSLLSLFQGLLIIQA